MGIPTLIKTLTASGDASLAFVHGASSVVFDNTYDEYMFVMTDMNPATDQARLTFQCSIDAGSNYNVTTTSNFWAVEHKESDVGTPGAPAVETGNDQHQGTSYQDIGYHAGNEADESFAGILHIFSPASTTYVKHYYARTSSNNGVRMKEVHTSGYFNDTNDIDAISFKMSSGNMDGVIQMYGIA